MISVRALVLCCATGLVSVPASAEKLSYSPISPSFGGNPNNTSHIQWLVQNQKTATAGVKDTATPGTGGSITDPTPGSSDADLFVKQLQSRLLSALSSQVAEAIFGQNPQDSGTITFGDTTVTFDRGLGEIRLVIDDGFGGVTEIVVPQLVTGNRSTAGLNSLQAEGALTPISGNSAASVGASLVPTSLSSGGLSGGSLTSSAGF